MTVFGDYARYYNLLYADKPYAKEVDFVLSCLSQAGAKPRTLLDLGCGTGRHALEMAQRGVSVTGVDMSETMLSMGKTALADCPAAQAACLPAMQYGDARTVRLGKTFDAVTSLFHVMSYQTTEDDALAVLTTAREHLKQGGMFLFDFWYGPGVLTDPPTNRERVLEDAHTRIERTATPVHHVADNVIDVQYHITLTDKSSGVQSRIEEVHSMRYWFMPELRHLAKLVGFAVNAEGAWMQDSAADLGTWNAWMLLQK